MDKPPYKLTIKLVGNRSEALSQALKRLDELCSDADSIGETTAKVVVTAEEEETLLEIHGAIEAYLKVHKLILEGECTLVSPVVRQPKDDKQAADQQRLSAWNTGKKLFVEAG